MAWRNYKDNAVVWFNSKGVTKETNEQSFEITSNEIISNIDATHDLQRYKITCDSASNITIYLHQSNGIAQYSLSGENIEILGQISGELTSIECSGLQNNEKVNIILYPYLSKQSASNFVDKQEGTASSLTQLLSIIRGEIWYNISVGLPLYEKISTKYQMDTVVISIINNHSEVKTIKEFSSSISGHNYSANILVETIFGDLTIGI